MFHTAETLRRVLVPFLEVGSLLLVALLGHLALQHARRNFALRRRQTQEARYRPLVDGILQSGVTAETRRKLARVRTADRPLIAALLLAPLHAARGGVVSHARDAAAALGLIDTWLADARDRRWWVRADAVRALGFVEHAAALPEIMSALGDGHAEVRAAGVESAGMLGDPRALEPLLAALVDGAHYQRPRVVSALRSMGSLLTPALIALARDRPACTSMALDVLGLIGTASAVDAMLGWCADPRASVRGAALSAIGTIGLDDRSYYFAVRALRDPDPDVRAMAARALGRGQREDAARYLAACLDDEWLPAAQAAGALIRLGAVGASELNARVGDSGQAGDLARQLLGAATTRQASA